MNEETSTPDAIETSTSTEVTAEEAIKGVDFTTVGDRGHAIVVIAATEAGELSMRTNVAGRDLFQVLGMAVVEVAKELHGTDNMRQAVVQLGGGRRATVRTSEILCGHGVVIGKTPEKCDCPPACACRSMTCRDISA